ncbi:MAG TPA: glycosyltransferase family 2 protein [Anaerolineae bacterium]|jgi:GT2 family glycosyltransferase
MSNHPLCSIIIPNYNGARFLPACFNALRTQTYPDLEIIMVDDGSTDESVSLTRRDFPEVKVIELKQNQGFIRAVNRGIEQATGPIIALLNNDTEVTPGWTQALVEALRHHPEAGMAASKLLLYDRRDVLHSAGDGFGADGIPINRGVWQKDEGQFDGDTYIFGGCGGAVAYRRAMLDDIGLFDEDLFMYLEDVDLSWRAQLAGYRIVFVPEAVVYHHVSATGGGVLASFYTGRNIIYILAKNLPAHLFRRHWPTIITAQFKIAAAALRAWRGEAARARLRGQLAGLWGLPKWLAKRKTVHQQRQATDEYLETLLTKI